MRLKEELKKAKLNNGGYSLVEVLVAVMVLAILSVTLIHGFTSTARTNLKARITQAASDLAQNTAEYYGAVDLASQEKAANENTSDSLTVTKAENGIEVFSFEEEGSNGTDFNVLVVLDPTEYTELNSYGTPALSNLYSNTNNYWMYEFTRFDATALSDLTKRTSSSITKDMVRKTSTINLTFEDGDLNASTVKYTYELKVTYTTTYNGSDYSYSQTVGSYEGTFSTAQEYAQGLYLVYTPYDTTSADCTDLVKINVDYKLSSCSWHSADTKDADSKLVPVYLIVQNMQRADGSSVVFDASNVSVTDTVIGSGVLKLMTNASALCGQLYGSSRVWGEMTADLSLTSVKSIVYAMDVYVSEGEFTWSIDENGVFSITEDYNTCFSTTTTKEETDLVADYVSD